MFNRIKASIEERVNHVIDLTDKDEILDLRHELAEAQSEIRRHHRDFERIRTTLEPYETHLDSWPGLHLALVREIRNIVG